MTSVVPKRILVFGSSGALGSFLVEYFSLKGYWVGNVDFGGSNSDKSMFQVVLDRNGTMEQQAEQIQSDPVLKEHRLDAIVCVAGGWAGGNAAHKDFIKNAELMWQQSVKSSLIAASIAPKFLKENGLLLLTGAQAALSPTPGMIGYGVAKAAVHQLTKSLGAEKSGLPQGSKALAILPVTLDTPTNRKWMKNADFGTWTPLSDVAKILDDWMQNIGEAPASGSIIQLITKDGKTDFVIE